MHNISNSFYFGTTLYMFRTVSPSIIRSLRLYIQHQVYVTQVPWLLASGNEMQRSYISIYFYKYIIPSSCILVRHFEWLVIGCESLWYRVRTVSYNFEFVFI